jgi:predicted MFS family arabinose efflux permease
MTHPDPLARARAIGIWGAGSGFGIAVGPLLGGIIVSTLGWRWAFWIGALAATGLAAATLTLVPRDHPPAPTRRFDLLGAILVTAFLASLVFALIEGPARGWAAPIVLTAFAATIALGAAFVAAQHRHPAPLVDLELMRHRVFATANLAAATLMFALLATSVYLSVFLQTFRGTTPLQTGLALLPVGAATAVLAAVSGRLTARLAARTLILLGLLCAAGGAILLSRLSAEDNPGNLWPALLLLGAGAGIALPATTATAVASVAVSRAGMASAIHNAGRQVGATLGIAILGSIVTAHATGGTPGDYARGLSIALVVAAAVLLAAAAITLKLIPRQRRNSRASGARESGI